MSLAPVQPGPDRDLLPISLIAHQVFCPRRAWLEAVGEETDTHQVAVGVAAHAPSDDPAASRAGRLRAVDVVSEGLGVTGRCDTLEVGDDGSLTVLEHKATPVRRRAVVTEPMRVQVALQALALRDMGHCVSDAAVYFATHKVRVAVELTDELLAQARDAVTATQALLDAPEAPPALQDDPRCTGCSHVAVCLPDERRLQSVARRVVVADPDTQVVHLTTPGARASTRGGRLVVQKAGEDLASVPLERVQGLVVHGNVDVSSALLREVLWRGLSIVWCSSSGRVVGWAHSASSPNGQARPRQHTESHQGRLDLPREMVAAKIANQATLLRRHAPDTEVTRAMRALQKRARTSGSIEELLGVEGDAAARYFGRFTVMLRPDAYADFAATFPGRRRRPAADRLNVALNYAYGLLLGDVIRAVVSCGLDPHAGFLHSSGRNKPALALDLAEEFRSTVAESAVLRAINNGELRASDFTGALGVMRLTSDGRKALVRAYEQRVTSTIRHPTFGYDVSWRRAMEVQARLVLGVVDGTQPRYVGLVTR